jgi:sirohydrochlorin ferrochelatase
MAEPRTALLLIAHGSREAAANEDLRRVAGELRGTGQFAAVVASFLELAEPNIDAGGATCIASGPERLILVPYFLSAGLHMKRDLVAARDRLAALYPQVDVRLADPLGPHPLLTEIVIQRGREANNDASR